VSWQGLEDFLERCRRRLDPVRGPERLPETGDMDVLGVEEMFAIRPAAVLIGVIDRDGEAMVLLPPMPTPPKPPCARPRKRSVPTRPAWN